MIRPATLLAVDAALEGVTGIALIAAPGIMTQLLFASALEGAGVIVARIGGMGLLGLALACWPARVEGARRSGVAGLFAYNLLTGIYMLIVGLGGVAVGILLWPAVVVHLIVAALIADVWRRNPLE